MCVIHFSLDDVKGIFKYLISNRPRSIFETRTLNFLDRMHEIYGISVDMYCTYQHLGYSLNDVPDIYRNQFEENKWLRFGYHCLDETIDINENELVFIKSYSQFQKILFSVIGQNKIINSLRLHRFAGNKDICMYLKQSGVNCLLTADDGRDSYYLNKFENAILADSYQYYDKETDISFVRSCTRLENFKREDFSDLEKEVYLYLDKKCDIIPVFSHEYLLDRVEVRNRFERCCQLSLEING